MCFKRSKKWNRNLIFSPLDAIFFNSFRILKLFVVVLFTLLRIVSIFYLNFLPIPETRFRSCQISRQYFVVVSTTIGKKVYLTRKLFCHIVSFFLSIDWKTEFEARVHQNSQFTQLKNLERHINHNHTVEVNTRMVNGAKMKEMSVLHNDSFILWLRKWKRENLITLHDGGRC